MGSVFQGVGADVDWLILVTFDAEVVCEGDEAGVGLDTVLFSWEAVDVNSCKCPVGLSTSLVFPYEAEVAGLGDVDGLVDLDDAEDFHASLEGGVVEFGASELLEFFSEVGDGFDVAVLGVGVEASVEDVFDEGWDGFVEHSILTTEEVKGITYGFPVFEEGGAVGDMDDPEHFVVVKAGSLLYEVAVEWAEAGGGGGPKDTYEEKGRSSVDAVRARKLEVRGLSHGKMIRKNPRILEKFAQGKVKAVFFLTWRRGARS